MGKRLLCVILGIILVTTGIASTTLLAYAEEADHIVISEIYVDEINAGSEWIELYNPTNTEINISEWIIDTKSDTDADATITNNAKIKPFGYYLIGDLSGGSWKPDKSTWEAPDHKEAITLTDSDGWIRLRNSTGEIVDIVGWGTAAVYETLAVSKPNEGQSLQRKVSDTIDEDPGYGPAWDSGNNSADFFIQTNPNPQNSSSPGPTSPTPELPTIFLLSAGLITLGGYVWIKRQRQLVT